MVVEKTIDIVAFEKYWFTEILTERKLMESPIFTKSYNTTLVQEVYSILSTSIKGIYIKEHSSSLCEKENDLFLTNKVK